MFPSLFDVSTPTMVAKNSSSSSSSSFQNPNPNPNQGQISSSSTSTSNSHASLFDFSETMNSSSAIPKNSSFDHHSFASPSVSRMGSEKPVMGGGKSSGLSKPRLVKVRKHFVSNQGRSIPLSGKQVDSSFDSCFNVSNESKVDELSDQWTGWNPFASNTAQKCKSSTSSGTPLFGGSNGSRVEELNDQWNSWNPFASNSVQKNKSSTSSLNPNLNLGKNGVGETIGKPLSDEMRKLNIGGEASGERENLNTNGEELNDQWNSWIPFAPKSVFVFGSKSKKKSGLEEEDIASVLPDEMKKLNIERSVNSEGVEKANDADHSSKVNDKNVPVFGSSNNVPDASCQIPESKLPDEMEKLNIHDNVNASGVEKTKDSGFSSKATGNNKSVPNSFSEKLPDEMKKMNIEDYGTAGGVKKTKDTDFSSKTNEKNAFIFGMSDNVPNAFAQSTGFSLPDEMKKLNVEDYGTASGVEKTKHTDSSGKANEKKSFVFGCSDSTSGSSKTTLPNGMHKLNSIPTSFTFQSGLHSTGLGENSVPHSDSKLSGASVFSSWPGLQSTGNPFEVPSKERTERNAEFSFSSSQDGLDTPLFRATKQDVPCPSAGNLDAGLNRKLDFSAKKATKDNTRLKKRKNKLKPPGPGHQFLGKDYVSKGNSSEENPESPGPYSPMDVSPYQETLAADQFSREASVASEEFLHFDAKCASNNAHPSAFVDATDENPVTATQRAMDINEDLKHEEINEDTKRYQFEKGDGVKCPIEEFVSGVEAECLRSQSEKVDTDGDAIIDTMKTEADKCSNIERQASDDRLKFSFTPSSDNASGTRFTFVASPSAQGNLSPSKRHCRRKNRRKVGQDAESPSFNAKMQFTFPSVPLFTASDSASQYIPGHDDKKDSSIFNSKENNQHVADKKAEVNEAYMTRSAAIIAAQEACETWRLRGNQAYAHGNIAKAETYYTRGVNCISSNEASKGCLNALVLCYSNRAAARMSLRRMREALGDCKKAESIDPNFLKVQVRAANCYLELGEIEDAVRYFQKCLQSRDRCLDRKLVIEASDGLQKAQKVSEYFDRCAELLQRRKFDEAESALRIIAEALLISPHSEKLVEMKAEALFMLRRYEEVVQLCEQTLSYAAKSATSMNADGQFANMDCSDSLTTSHTRFWCLCLISKSYFYLGRLEEALDFLQKVEQMGPVTEMGESKNLTSLVSLSVTIRELLHHKASGNEAFQSGKHTEAVEHYTAALSCKMVSRPFAAICFCNRAAAYQALGQLSDAIADCSLAIALNGSYAKAISRRATLHEMIRDYGKAAMDLQKLISLLEKQKEDKTNQSGKLGKPTSSMSDLRQARSRLSTLEEEGKKELPLNMYLILGIEPSVEAADIKKAYRKAALRHHPDKAGQLLPRSENGDDGVWKEIAEEVHRDADRLFKMIGEAYAVLSDSAKRSRYDLEEEFRNTMNKSNGSNTSRSSEYHSHPFERSSSSRRQWQEAWKSYHSQRWSEASRSSRYY